MHISIAGTSRLGRLLFPALFGAAALGACTDGQPIAPREQGQPTPEQALQALDCTASVAEGAVRCAPATPGTGQASGIIYGGQNVYVTLAASNHSYDGGTEIFSVDVTVQNLLNEAIGTPDGTTADPEGIRVFIYDDPVAVTGSGNVSVYEPDGTAFFTAADQPYFAYPEILGKDEVSAANTWTFQVASTVTTFRFRVLIETDVQYLLVINEVLANPGGTISDVNGEWFELYNAGTMAVDLQNLVIADSAASGRRPYHLIGSSLVVPSGGYAVLGNTTNTTLNGGATVDYAYGSALTLANSLDAVKIARVYGSDTLTLDRTQYASAAVSAQNGVSRELTNPALDNSNMDGSNWADALVTAVYGEGGRGTPRAQNSTFTP